MPELPKYRCHKEVRAIKIQAISYAGLGSNNPKMGALLYPFESCHGPITVDHDYIAKHEPRVGGYYVEYSGGYKSFSPAEAFESGYTRIEE